MEYLHMSATPNPSDAFVRRPAVRVFPNYPCHDGVRDTHGDATEYSKFGVAQFVQIQERGQVCNKLANVDHSAQNECHIVIDAQCREEGWSIVDESVDP